MLEQQKILYNNTGRRPFPSNYSSWQSLDEEEEAEERVEERSLLSHIRL